MKVNQPIILESLEDNKTKLKSTNKLNIRNEIIRYRVKVNENKTSRIYNNNSNEIRSHSLNVINSTMLYNLNNGKSSKVTSDKPVGNKKQNKHISLPSLDNKAKFNQTNINLNNKTEIFNQLSFKEANSLKSSFQQSNFKTKTDLYLLFNLLEFRK